MHGKYPVWLDTARDGVKCNTMQSGNEYSTVQYSTVQYSTVQYSAVQYSTPPRWGAGPASASCPPAGGPAARNTGTTTFYVSLNVREVRRHLMI